MIAKPRHIYSVLMPTFIQCDDSRQLCGHAFEDTIHFFLECPLYQHDKITLSTSFNNIVHISIEYITVGYNAISEKMNTLLFKSARGFIRQSYI